MKMRKMASLEIENKSFFVAPVLNFLDSLVSNHPNMDYNRYSRFRYVVADVLGRRIKNAYPGKYGKLTVDFYFSVECFEVSIKDMGIPSWDNFSSAKESVDVNNPVELRNYLLDLWLDGIGMEKLGKDGQRIYMRMNILHHIQLKEPEPYPEIEVLDTNITIRQVESEEDIIEAIRCIYNEYGYKYPHEHLYYMDKFMKLIRNKEVFSFIAVNDHGQTAGHFALKFSDSYKNMPEIANVVTRKEFRGLGLMKKYMEFCDKFGKEHGIRALMGEPVAYHPISQKAFLSAGFTATTLKLAYVPPMEGYQEKHRSDLFACVKIIDDNAQSIVYPPEEMFAFVKNVYDSLGWKYEMHRNSEKAEHTKISTEVVPGMGIASVCVDKASDDFEDILKSAVKDSTRKKAEMIELLISLNDQSCPFAYEIAKKQEFFTSGLLPGGENSDYLVMQKLVGIDKTYENIVAVGAFEQLQNELIAIDN